MVDYQDLTALGNVKEASDHILCIVNTKIYTLDTIHSAAYILVDKAYILLDGDPSTEIKVEIRKKTDVALKDLAREFNEQLLNYAVYNAQSERNKKLREAIILRTLLTNAPDKVIDKIKKIYEDETGEEAKLK
ncbi:hypothetical protein IIC44_01680 [Patescibacteria group bacterium]|nr:hypothetical protein [Patescibacteria group bacterium]